MKRIIFDLGNKTMFVVTDEYVINCDKIKVKENSKLLVRIEKFMKISILIELVKSLFNDSSITHTRTYITNGEWIWSGDLNFYTKRHYFRWPDGFLKSLSKNEFRMPKLSVTKIQELEAICFEIERTIYNDDWRNSDFFLNKFPKLNLSFNTIVL